MSSFRLKELAYSYTPSSIHPFLKRIENSEIGSRLARGVFWSIAGSVISRGLMLCASILVARMLGKTGFGELGMIQSTVGMFGVFAGFGLGVTATKHIAEFRKSDPERAGRIIGISGFFAIGTGGLLSLALLILAPWLAEHTINAPHLADLLRIGALILFINALNGAQTGALAGFEAFKKIAKVNVIVGLISFPILVTGAYFGGLTGAVWALAFNLGFNWLINHLALRQEAKRFGVPFTIQGCQKEWPILWKFSFPASISGAMVAPVFWVCKSLLANQPEGYSGLGLLAVAESWRAMLFFACGLISQAYFPVLAQLYAQGKRRMFMRALVTQFYINGAIVSLGVAFVVVLVKPILAMYGQQFSDGSPVLIIIMVSCIPMQLANVAGIVNKCVGNIWWGVLLNTLWAIVLLICTYLLIGKGVLGLAWAILISYCFHLILTSVYLIWVFRTSPKLIASD